MKGSESDEDLVSLLDSLCWRHDEERLPHKQQHSAQQNQSEKLGWTHHMFSFQVLGADITGNQHCS
jgi:hypothetical protein